MPVWIDRDEDECEFFFWEHGSTNPNDHGVCDFEHTLEVNMPDEQSRRFEFVK